VGEDDGDTDTRTCQTSLQLGFERSAPRSIERASPEEEKGSRRNPGVRVIKNAFIASNPLSETTVYFQSVYYNDTVS